jgi:hypothetical protein
MTFYLYLVQLFSSFISRLKALSFFEIVNVTLKVIYLTYSSYLVILGTLASLIVLYCRYLDIPVRENILGQFSFPLLLLHLGLYLIPLLLAVSPIPLFYKILSLELLIGFLLSINIYQTVQFAYHVCLVSRPVTVLDIMKTIGTPFIVNLHWLELLIVFLIGLFLLSRIKDK